LTAARESATSEDLSARFLMRLARALHHYGMPVHRVEHALSEVAGKLGVEAQFLVTPTSIVTSFGDEEGARTFLARLDQGEADLSKLAALNDLLREVFAGRTDAGEAAGRVAEIEARPPLYGPVATALSFGVVSSIVAMFFGGAWRELVVAGALGLTMGVLAVLAGRSKRFALVLPALAGIVCAAGAQVAAHVLQPLFPSIPTLAGLIVLLPGLTLTIAVNELAHGHVVSGSARLMSALVTFLQIGFGLALGIAVVTRLFGASEAIAPQAFSLPVLAVALAVNALALAVLFQARLRDVAAVLVAAATAFFGARFGTEHLGLELGTCFGAWLLGTVAAVIARWRDVPSAIPTLPGLLLPVPGPLGFRSLSALIAKDVASGVEAGFTMAIVALALVTGLLLASLTIEPRKLF
jgi:uncharacterized membrane protein YjjP (DUF1212 family)